MTHATLDTQNLCEFADGAVSRLVVGQAWLQIHEDAEPCPDCMAYIRRTYGNPATLLGGTDAYTTGLDAGEARGSGAARTDD